MTDFPFTVDEEFARKHNEFFRDAKRLQVSAGILAVIMFAITAVMLWAAGATILTLGLGIAFSVFGLLSLLMIPILPRKMGSPQQYYDLYKLAPAVVARVNPRDMDILALVNASADPEKIAPALAVRTVSSVPGVAREVGAHVPSAAVTGVQTLRERSLYQEVSPMPIAWGTQDKKVLQNADKAFTASEWKEVEGLVDRLEDVQNTKRNLLILD
ncbi:DUF3239 domain-containing protein [Corynebacterium sp. 320]|uniref:DUF3239 domain-containing protein n=1 Tax=Corynebacterium zhongnanshanii TaxID=2768834 RepID=A0ABQ6VE42_9CORY|nr:MULTISPECIES: DUF3239 domain-containing protein [Corynebacterium]KAB1501344.1 DUF3239 domain-containing protein [Corynebacterium sp. 320]KAB1551513.1 DUF3239 domain-containing protein [Corynebacterium sp. 321]KAB1551659.1 DUF3239 domain-containing protein [Corynebacterium sp. 319]KAB3521056.1 DUF3239 domain-containing protein [Corynebacterium zhongnanshanii]KAB3525709.1 DUF3239 domain-containing protein [Corynebacterium sp. 250]